MTSTSFEGKLARLTPFDVEQDSLHTTRWYQDSEFQRLWSATPSCMRSYKEERDAFEKDLDEIIAFAIRPLNEDRMIGLILLDGFDSAADSAWLAIGIGERDYRGRGFGTDAVQILVRFAFQELNLHRINLGVFECNPQAFHIYQKLGFKEEGRMRNWLNRFGRRWDLIYMGLLRPDWEAAQKLDES